MNERTRYNRHGLRPALRPTTSMAALTAALGVVTLGAAAPAAAQTAQPTTSSLLEEMVATGVITKAQSDQILKGAQARDAAKAAAAPQAIPAGAPGSTTTLRAADGTVHVQYVPQAVKDQIKAEVKQEVMAKAEAEGWAAPNQMPEWTRRIKISGDVRFRSEEDMFPKSSVTGSFDQVNWASLDARSTPVDIANLTNIPGGGTTGSNAFPFNNWDKNRERERLRARVAVDADLGESFSTGVRLATGSDSQPVSTNQTLGTSGGNFSKYQLWLDRAFIRYEPLKTDTTGFAATVGRFANPFFSTDLVWNENINFDGIAASGRYRVAQGVTPFITVGAFPVFNTALDFSTYSEDKTTSQDRWLFAGQAGTDWKAAKDTTLKVGVAYYYFNNIEGRQTNCFYNDITCGSDVFRPTFAQKGNTYMPLRNNTGRTSSTDPDYQYFGLAGGFHELALTGRIDYDGLKPIFPGQALRVSVDGDFAKNLAFNKNSVATKSNIGGIGLNNRNNDVFKGGDTGYLARLTIGTPELARRWDWNVSVAYKYIESDAVVDAFTDSDFGMGGTNLKGYILGGTLALARTVWTGLHWMSADSIAGTPYANDIVMLDINAKF